MIDQQTLLTYLAILLGFVLIPGPAVLLTLARSMASGTQVGIATGLGIAAGDLMHTVLAVVGASAIVAASATAFSIVKYAGAVYLVYLGIRAIVDRDESDPDMVVARISSLTAFRQAIVAEVLNPKSALFFLAFLPQFVNPDNGPVSGQLLVLGALFVLMGLIATLGVAFCGATIGTYLQKNAKVVRWQGKVVGAIYCGLGFRLALQQQ